MPGLLGSGYISGNKESDDEQDATSTEANNDNSGSSSSGLLTPSITKQTQSKAPPKNITTQSPTALPPVSSNDGLS